jgi:antitoxin component YwqK of YwqJK toxin-antitoxin module
VFNSNDEIWQDGNFKNGLLWDGKVYEYDRDGILLKVKVYKNGLYHSDGQL